MTLEELYEKSEKGKARTRATSSVNAQVVAAIEGDAMDAMTDRVARAIAQPGASGHGTATIELTDGGIDVTSQGEEIATTEVDSKADDDDDDDSLDFDDEDFLDAIDKLKKAYAVLDDVLEGYLVDTITMPKETLIDIEMGMNDILEFVNGFTDFKTDELKRVKSLREHGRRSATGVGL